MVSSNIIYRKVGNYFVPTNIINPADEIHVVTNDKTGYAGSTFKFELEDGSAVNVTGPWHTNSTALFKNTGINLSELHLSQIILRSYLTGDILYEEKEPVLGSFYRGYRAALQLAVARNEPVTLQEISQGGGRTVTLYPDHKHIHPLSRRKEDNASEY